MIIHGKVTERTGSTFVIFGYNGRDGVVTDRNGLLYMRARYYSPEHRRFVNADVIPGEISNAITLNRYAYANGNPVSNVDPFGLSAERGSININSLFDIFAGIKDEKELTLKLLTATRNQLLSFEDLLTISNNMNSSFPAGPNTTVSFSSSMSRGTGDIKLSQDASGQIELLSSLTFDMTDCKVSINKDGSISITYSNKIDDYNTISASISASYNASFTANYSVTTKDQNNNSLSTSMGLTYKNTSNNPNAGQDKEKIPIYSYEQEPAAETADDGTWLRVLGGAIILGFALVSDVFGIVGDDAVLVPIGLSLIGA